MGNGNAAQGYLPNVVIPTIRRIFPTMINASSITPSFSKKMLKMPFSDIETQKLRGCMFLSNCRLKKGIRNFHPKNSVRIVKVYFENGKPYKDIYTFFYQNEIDDFFVELATLADLHGIIKLTGSTVWVKQIEDVKNLNVDDKLIDRLSRALTGKGFVS